MNDELRSDLNALIDGALPAERADELRARIERDADVRREYEALRRVVDAVRGLPREPAPAALRERLASLRKAPRGRIRWLRFGGLAAAAAALLVAVTLAVRSERTRPLPGEAKAGRAPAASDDSKSRFARDAGEAPGAPAVPATVAKEAAGAEQRSLGKSSSESKDKEENKEEKDGEAPAPAEAARKAAADAGERAKPEAERDFDDAAGAKSGLGADKQDGHLRRERQEGAEAKDEAGAKKVEKVQEDGASNAVGAENAAGLLAGRSDLVAAVQAGVALKTGARLNEYLGLLAKREPGDVVNHIASFVAPVAPPDAPESKAKRGKVQRSLAALIENREEAALISAVLRRAFPIPPDPKAKARPPAAGLKSGRARATRFFEIALTEPQIAQVQAWLDRVSVAGRKQGRADRPGVRAAGKTSAAKGAAGKHAGETEAGAGVPKPAAVAPRRYRVELTFPLKK